MRFIPYDIGTYLVKSRTRDGHHIVDMLEVTCSCEGYDQRGTCEHLQDLLRQKTNMKTVVAMRARNPMTCPLIL